MNYTKTIWINGFTPLNADNMNNIENGIEQLYLNQSIPYTSEEIDELLEINQEVSNE